MIAIIVIAAYSYVGTSIDSSTTTAQTVATSQSHSSTIVSQSSHSATSTVKTSPPPTIVQTTVSSDNPSHTTSVTTKVTTTLTSVSNSDTPARGNLRYVRTGAIVAIFSYYSPTQQNDVNEVIQAKQEYPSVNILAVINPAGGPGSYDQHIAEEVGNMQAANISVLGYTPTEWGTRNIRSVEADILNYHNWYHVDGLQLDQMPNWEYDGPQGQWWSSGPNGYVHARLLLQSDKLCALLGDNHRVR